MSKAAQRACAWCSGPIRDAARRDSVCCSKRCRQARHRFSRAVGTATVTARPLRLAYADPPYPGKASKYYRDHPDFAGEVDHVQLLAQLASFDGWALSTSAAALRELLPLCPPEVQVAAWHRGERPHRGARGPLSAWEPVLYRGGRPDLERYLSCSAEHDTSRADPHDAFATWSPRRLPVDAGAARHVHRGATRRLARPSHRLPGLRSQGSPDRPALAGWSARLTALHRCRGR